MSRNLNSISNSIDTIDPTRVAALHAILNLNGKPPKAGDQLPPFWHWVFYWDMPRPQLLGEDGHIKTGGFIPDLGMEQRMWSAGSLEIRKPLIVGDLIERKSTIEKIEEKHGQSGLLKFVTIRHEFIRDGLAIEEIQQLVYRNVHQVAIPNPTVELPECASLKLERVFDEIALFRYSALTFNSHRIHYDVDYCRKMAGYPNLVVHGPLLATFLAQVAVKNDGDFKKIKYRATAPAFCGESIRFFAADSGEGMRLWACSKENRLCMTAETTN